MPTAPAPAGAPDPWEAAYLRFETPEQETSKFLARLKTLGADQWPRDAAVVELFCGRGNGMRALERLGFSDVDGVDRSPSLIGRYQGPARRYVGDCRQLPLRDHCKDILIVQGGLHHLVSLPGDLELTLSETRRVLRPGGLFVVVEPWHTPFLALVHLVCRSRTARRVSARVDALADMTDHERTTYEQWLGQPDLILAVLARHFRTELRGIAWGKLMLRCRPL
jgi:ubiquinone/menaquinone biosynthesis C-methylase UbiE